MPQEIFAKEPLGGRWAFMQRVIAVLGVAVFILASIMPPWTEPTDSGSKHRTWRLLFDPPRGAAEIDWPILVFEWFVLFVATVILVWVFRSQSKSEQGY
jgi:hypothetical protein